MAKLGIPNLQRVYPVAHLKAVFTCSYTLGNKYFTETCANILIAKHLSFTGPGSRTITTDLQTPNGVDVSWVWDQHIESRELNPVTWDLEIISNFSGVIAQSPFKIVPAYYGQGQQWSGYTTDVNVSWAFHLNAPGDVWLDGDTHPGRVLELWVSPK